MKVPSLSSKTFEQSAGFLRIRGGKAALDQTGIHPERYQAVKDMLNEAGVSVAQAMGGQIDKVVALREKWTQLIGEFTFDDIVQELRKPGRDPRDPYKVFSYRDDIHEVKDLKEGMICPGIVTNVTNFGAFVDIGVHQDGLVHISQLTHAFVDDPRVVVSPGDQVTVKVIGVDLEKNQIALTMKLEEKPAAAPRPRPAREDRPRGDRNGDRPRREGSDRGDRPRGDRSEQRSAHGDRDARPANRDGSGKSKDARPDKRGDKRGGGGKPQQKGPGQGGGGKPQRPPGKPFNNPFAALQVIKK